MYRRHYQKLESQLSGNVSNEASAWRNVNQWPMADPSMKAKYNG